MKQVYKLGARIWITLISVISFLLGWVMFAHSNKPVSAQAAQNSSTPADNSSQLAPIPTLPPIQSFNGQSQAPSQSNSSLLQPIQPQQMPSFNFPMMRSGGS